MKLLCEHVHNTCIHKCEYAMLFTLSYHTQGIHLSNCLTSRLDEHDHHRYELQLFSITLPHTGAFNIVVATSGPHILNVLHKYHIKKHSSGLHHPGSASAPIHFLIGADPWYYNQQVILSRIRI